jgi:DinB superfamily
MPAAASAGAVPGITVLEQTPIVIEKIVLSATDEEMGWKPSMDRWSISEVLGHLADAEVVGFRERVRAMMEQKNPAIASYDQNAAYAAGKYAGLGRENLKKFCHERDRSLSILRYVSPDVLGRTAQHSKIGSFTVAQLLNEWAFHDLGHIRQIAELFRARAFYPHCGPFQQYYKINP